MNATRLPRWLLHIVLALVAMAGVVRAGAAWGDRSASTVRSEHVLVANDDAPRDDASTRRERTTCTAWQRGCRRTPRIVTSRSTSVDRGAGAAFGTMPTGRIGAPSSARREGGRDPSRLRAAPTRAPPTDC